VSQSVLNLIRPLLLAALAFVRARHQLAIEILVLGNVQAALNHELHISVQSAVPVEVQGIDGFGPVVAL